MIPPMRGKPRRGPPPMPARLDVNAVLRVSDQGGRIVRAEELAAGTDLRERLRLAHENYARQGYAVGELRPGQWAFFAERGSQRLLVAIRQAIPQAGAQGAGRDQ